MLNSRFEHLELRRVAPLRVLAIFVTSSRLVQTRLLELQEDWPQEELDAMSRVWNERFTSLTLREVRARLLAVMAEEKAVFDTLVERALEMGRQALAGQDPADELHLDGAANILDVPEFADPGIRPWCRQRQALLLLDQCLCTDWSGSSSAGALPESGSSR
jgi:heat-inducible transcriptional repressor